MVRLCPMTNDHDDKPVTLDDLATMVKKGFDEMDEKFSGINKKFDNLDVKIDAKPSQHHVDSRFAHLENIVVAKTDEASLARDRKLDEKTNVVAQTLGIKTIFTQEEVIAIKHITPFAIKPAMN